MLFGRFPILLAIGVYAVRHVRVLPVLLACNVE